jgi:hypothetical protein
MTLLRLLEREVATADLSLFQTVERLYSAKPLFQMYNASHDLDVQGVNQ